MTILFKDMDLPESCISDYEVCPILKADLCKAFPLITASVVHQYFEQGVVNKGRLKNCPLVEVAICTEQQWIPVSERLPVADDYRESMECLDGCVWYFTDKGSMGLGYYYYSTKEWSTLRDLKPDGKVIAWMPIPEPYKKGDKNGCD